MRLSFKRGTYLIVAAISVSTLLFSTTALASSKSEENDSQQNVTSENIETQEMLAPALEEDASISGARAFSSALNIEPQMEIDKSAADVSLIEQDIDEYIGYLKAQSGKEVQELTEDEMITLTKQFTEKKFGQKFNQPTPFSSGIYVYSNSSYRWVSGGTQYGYQMAKYNADLLIYACEQAGFKYATAMLKQAVKGGNVYFTEGSYDPWGMATGIRDDWSFKYGDMQPKKNWLMANGKLGTRYTWNATNIKLNHTFDMGIALNGVRLETSAQYAYTAGNSRYFKMTTYVKDHYDFDYPNIEQSIITQTQVYIFNAPGYLPSKYYVFNEYDFTMTMIDYVAVPIWIAG